MELRLNLVWDIADKTPEKPILKDEIVYYNVAEEAEERKKAKDNQRSRRSWRG